MGDSAQWGSDLIKRKKRIEVTGKDEMAKKRIVFLAYSVVRFYSYGLYTPAHDSDDDRPFSFIA